MPSSFRRSLPITGAAVIVTAAGAPRKGARVDVTGRVQDGYDLSAFGNVIKLPGAMRSGLVLIESSHKAKD